MRCVGVDLHKDQFVTCFLEEDGESTVEQFHLDTHSLEKFAAYCAEMTGSRLKRDARLVFRGSGSGRSRRGGGRQRLAFCANCPIKAKD